MSRSIVALIAVTACLLWFRTASPASAAALVDAPHAGRTPTGPVTVTAPDAVGEPLSVESGVSSDLVVGLRAPDFDLDGSNGHPVRLADLRGRWSVIVFADDREALVPMRAITDSLQRAGITLYGICEADAPALVAFARQAQLPFALLADLDADVSRAYGMYDDVQDAVEPGVVILDANGTLRVSLSGQELPPGELLALALHTAAKRS